MTSARWQSFSLGQQLGHIGSELSRAAHWEREQAGPERDQALCRALELICLSLETEPGRRPLQELTRLKETVLDQLSNLHSYKINLEQLTEYCNQQYSYRLNTLKN